MWNVRIRRQHLLCFTVDVSLIVNKLWVRRSAGLSLNVSPLGFVLDTRLDMRFFHYWRIQSELLRGAVNVTFLLLLQ